jgi:hypothetical protein
LIERSLLHRIFLFDEQEAGRCFPPPKLGEDGFVQKKQSERGDSRKHSERDLRVDAERDRARAKGKEGLRGGSRTYTGSWPT